MIKPKNSVTLGQVAAAVLKALLCGVLGGFILGFLGGVTTFYVYFIGGWFGIPIGFIVGVIASRVFSLADVLFTFGLGIGAWELAEQLTGPHSEPSVIQLVYVMAPFAVGIVTMLGCFLSRKHVPDTFKLAIGGVLSPLVSLGILGYFFRLY